MRYLGRYIAGLFLVTVLMLLYVNQHVTSIRYSYTINKKEDTLIALRDEAKSLQYQLAAIKSPTTLEERLAEAEVTLVLPEHVEILTVPVVPVTPPLHMAQQRSESSQASGVLAALGFGREAQAQNP